MQVSWTLSSQTSNMDSWRLRSPLILFFPLWIALKLHLVARESLCILWTRTYTKCVLKITSRRRPSTRSNIKMKMKLMWYHLQQLQELKMNCASSQFFHLYAALSKEMLFFPKMLTKSASLSDNARAIGLDPLSSYRQNSKKLTKKRMKREVLPEREKGVLWIFWLIGTWHKL